MVNVNVTGGEMSQAEINSYIDRAQKLYPEKTIQTIDLKIDGDFVDVEIFDVEDYDLIGEVTA